MQWRRSFLAQHLEMMRRAVALVGGQSVLWEDRVPGADHRVTLNLRDDGRRSDRGGERVAMDDRRLGAIEADAHGVDKQVVGTKRELTDGLFHRALRGPVDVDLVDGGDVDSSYRPGQSVLADSWRKRLALLALKQLGITQAANAVAGIENHRGSNHWAEERSAADFVNAGDQLRACSPREFFVLQRALQLLQQAQLQSGLRNRLLARRLLRRFCSCCSGGGCQRGPPTTRTRLLNHEERACASPHAASACYNKS